MSGNVLVGKSKQVKQSTKSTRHGQSKLLVPHSAESLASAEFMDFAPYPCICFSCLPSKAQKKRVYSRVYENKLETNNCPCAPWLCCTPEGCINDAIYTAYYSHPPFRVGMCPTPCCCVPCTCCGPPVIYIREPTCCCCIDCRPCCGETIVSSPANCFDLKCCLCCGLPCHMIFCSRPLVWNVRNGRLFLSKLKATTQEYHAKHGFAMEGKAAQNAVYREVTDRGDCFYGLCSTTRDIAAWKEPLQAPPISEVMEREIMEASSSTESTVHYSNSSGMDTMDTAMMVAAVPVPVPVDSRRRSYDNDVNHNSEQNRPYDSVQEDNVFDDMAKQYHSQRHQDKEVGRSTKQSAVSKSGDQEGRNRRSSRQARNHQGDESEIIRQSYTRQANAPQEKRTSVDTYDESNYSFAESAHFGESMFQGATLDARIFDDSDGAFANTSTLQDSVALDAVPALRPTTEHKTREKKKSSRNLSGESRGHREGCERKSSSHKHRGGEKRKSRRPREDGGRASSRARDGDELANSKPRQLEYSPGVGVTEMERE